MSANTVHILSHPLVNAKMAVLRDSSTSAKDFREGIRDLTYIVAIEASRDLEERPVVGVSAHKEYPTGFWFLTIKTSRTRQFPSLLGLVSRCCVQ